MQAVWQTRLKEIAREYSQQRNKRLKDMKIPDRKILGTFDRVLRIHRLNSGIFSKFHMNGLAESVEN